MLVKVNSGNMPAMAFFKSNGFSYIRHEHFDYYSLTHLEKTLFNANYQRDELKIPDYEKKIIADQYGVVDRISKDHSPLLGMISLPFDDISYYCRRVILRFFLNRNHTGRPNQLITVDLTDSKCNLEAIKESCKRLDSSGGVFLKHLEFNESFANDLIKIAATNGFFIVYWSTQILNRGSYIQAGTVPAENVIERFVAKGYLNADAIPKELYDKLPNSTTAIELIQEKIMDHNSGNKVLNAEIIKSWQEIIRTILDSCNEVGMYTELVKNALFASISERLSGRPIPIDGDTLRSSIELAIRYVLTATVYSHSATPGDFLDYILKKEFPEIFNDSKASASLVSELRKYRLLSYENSQYNTTSFVREVVKKYLSSNNGFGTPGIGRSHSEIMVDIVRSISDHIDRFTDCTFPLEMIYEAINSNVGSTEDFYDAVYNLLSEPFYYSDSVDYYKCLGKIHEIIQEYEGSHGNIDGVRHLGKLSLLYARSILYSRDLKMSDALRIRDDHERWFGQDDDRLKLKFEYALIPQTQSKDGIDGKFCENVYVKPYSASDHRLLITYALFRFYRDCQRTGKDNIKDAIEQSISEIQEFGFSISNAAKILHWQLISKRMERIQNTYCDGLKTVVPIDLKQFTNQSQMFPHLFAMAVLENMRIHIHNLEISEARGLYLKYGTFIESLKLNGELDECRGDYYRLLGKTGKSIVNYTSAVMMYVRDGRSMDSILVKVKIMELKSENNDYDSLEGIRKELEEFLNNSKTESYTTLKIRQAINRAYN